MKELFAALYTKFKSGGNSFYTALSGRLHLFNAPQNETLPYAVYSKPTGDTDYNFTNTFDYPQIQFDIFSDAVEQDATEILNLRNYCSALFDDCTLTVTNYDFLKMERAFEVGPIKEIDMEVWRYTIAYDIWLEK